MSALEKIVKEGKMVAARDAWLRMTVWQKLVVLSLRAVCCVLEVVWFLVLPVVGLLK